MPSVECAEVEVGEGGGASDQVTRQGVGSVQHQDVPLPRR